MTPRRSASVDRATGTARTDRRTKSLITRLQAGDVAVIDHRDLDRIAAEGLVHARPAAIVNAARSLSGRYPNVGPLLIAAAGIPLVDDAGEAIFDMIAEGDIVTIDGADVRIGDVLVATGIRQTAAALEHDYETAKLTMGAELERFAENTLTYMREERHFLLDPPDIPDLRIDLKGRHVLIVVRGHDYREDLSHLRSYIQEMRPVIIGVDGGADAVLEVGFRPDLIVGDFDSVSTSALRMGAQLVVHAYPDGRMPGASRLEELGLPFVPYMSPGTSEDIAMILAYEKGAALIVAVGTHASMVEFLDKGREGMASTFLVRLRVGPILVDAKGVSRLYQGRIRKRDLSLFLFAVLISFAVIVLVAVPQVIIEGVWLVVRSTWNSMVGATW